MVDPTLPVGYVRKPEWLRIQLAAGSDFAAVKKSLANGRLHTVCEEARCPNQHECWGSLRTATFMILGDTCTRHCRFCAVRTGLPRNSQGQAGIDSLDWSEPGRVAQAAVDMGLVHVVVTMVTRDDLPDGGAAMLAATVAAVRRALPSAGVEVLSSDLNGNSQAIKKLCASHPDILGHNLETVERLTPQVRSRSTWATSLDFLRQAAELGARTKSAMMLGLGETEAEILNAMDALRAVGVSILNLGQYLQPSRSHAPVVKYWTPAEFDRLRSAGLERGFSNVAAGPLVRSSYHAAEQARL